MVSDDSTWQGPLTISFNHILHIPNSLFCRVLLCNSHSYKNTLHMTPSCYAELYVYELWSAAVKTFLGFRTLPDTFKHMHWQNPGVPDFG